MKYKKITYGIVAILTILSFVSVSTFSTFARVPSNVTGDDLGGWHTYSGLNGGKAELLTTPPAFYNTNVRDNAKQTLFYLEKKDVTVDEFLITVESDDEIVVGFQSCTTLGDSKVPKISLVSKSAFGYGFDYNSASYDSIPDSLINYIERGYNSDPETYLDCHYSVLGWIFRDFDTISFATNNMKVFNSLTSACNYLNSGDTSGLIYDGANPPQKYDKSIKFNSFSYDVHDSNTIDNFYIDLHWSLPDELLMCDSLYWDISEIWEYEKVRNKVIDVDRVSNIANSNSVVDLKEYPNGVTLYLTDLDLFHMLKGQNDSFITRAVLGQKGHSISQDGSIGISNGSISAGISFSVGDTVTKSLVTLNGTIVANNVRGATNSVTYSLLDGSNWGDSFEPEEDGSYIKSGDTVSKGYYFTDVGTDSAGNTTYNYYYYGDDNSKHSISAEDSHNNSFTLDNDTSIGGGGSGGSTVSGGNTTITNNPTFNNNVSVNVEGDSINNDVNNIVSGSEHTTESGNKGFIARFLAFFEILKDNTFMSIMGDLFGWLPSEVFLCLAYAIGLVGGIAVFKFFRK